MGGYLFFVCVFVFGTAEGFYALNYQFCEKYDSKGSHLTTTAKMVVYFVMFMPD